MACRAFENAADAQSFVGENDTNIGLILTDDPAPDHPRLHRLGVSVRQIRKAADEMTASFNEVAVLALCLHLFYVQNEHCSYNHVLNAAGAITDKLSGADKETCICIIREAINSRPQTRNLEFEGEWETRGGLLTVAVLNWK